jgi:hypothetical protein
MHRAATLAILLVFDVKPGRIGLAEHCKGHTKWNNFAVLEEPHVLASKLDHAGLGLGSWHVILSWAEEKEEGNGDQVRQCPQCTGSVFATIMVGDDADGLCRQGQLGLGGQIIAFVGLQKPGERQVEIFAAVAASGVSISHQHGGLRHVTEGSFWGLEQQGNGA